MQLFFYSKTMEKEKILSTLTEKLGKTSFSQKTLETYVAKHLPAEGTEPDDAYWALHTEVLKTMEGQYNHDVAVAVEEAKKNFDTSSATNTSPTNPNPATPPADNALAKRIEALEKALEDEKKKSSVDALKNSARGKSSELKVSNKALWDDAVNMVEISGDMDEAKLVDAAKGIYETKLKAYIGEGATPYGGSMGVSTQVGEAEAKERRNAFKERMIAQGKLPKEEGTNV